MSSIAQIKDGQIVNQVTSHPNEKKSVNSTLDKDAFLQLLVAQMKYQDPLQPTSNTEYISQLATFSELEEMQNLNSGMTLQRASALVGQYVYMSVTDSTGNTTYPEGKVEFVQYENNKAYLSIDGTLYSIDDLDAVADATYKDAVDIAEAFVTELYKLPKAEYIAQTDLQNIENLIIVYENMTSYEKSFLGDENKELYAQYKSKYQELAITPVQNFIKDLENLPELEEITSEQIGAMHALIKTYDNFSSYQKGLLDKETTSSYEAIVEKYNELMAE